jgi:heptaprenyl diphosphate synthase
MAGVERSAVDTVAEYGEVIGVAFQLSDDLIDVVSETGQSGKTPGTDLREGVATLPVLLAHDDAALMAVLAGDLSSDAALDEALRTLRAHPALEQARERMSSYVDRAREIALKLPEGAARQALVALADYVLARTG